MIRAAFLACAFSGLCAASSATAVTGGDLRTLAAGRYVCEEPAPATVSRGRVTEKAGFSIVTASSYRSDGTLGSYLRTDDLVVFTSGPRKGERYRRVSRGFLRKLDAAGGEGSLRCVLYNRNNF